LSCSLKSFLAYVFRVGLSPHSFGSSLKGSMLNIISSIASIHILGVLIYCCFPSILKQIIITIFYLNTILSKMYGFVALLKKVNNENF
jgi:hypothetical protein